MPLDSTNWSQTETETKPDKGDIGLKPDLSKPSARGLSYLLRHKELWPEGFIWNYGCHGTCAIGLASRVWLHHPHAFSAMVGKACGIDRAAAQDIFLNMAPDVLPSEVADRIDAYLAETRK